VGGRYITLGKSYMILGITTLIVITIKKTST